jgi:hypothetical protein
MPAERTNVAQWLLPRLPALDRLGVASSTVCAIHCLATPLVLAALPLVGLQVVLGESFEWAFVATGLSVGTLVLVPSFRRLHGRLLPLTLFIAGVSLWMLARVGLASDSVLELPTMLAGSASVITAHILNRRLCRACAACGEPRHVEGDL